MPSAAEVLLGGEAVHIAGTMNSDTTTISCDGYITGLYVNNCDVSGVIHLSFDGGSSWMSVSSSTDTAAPVGPFNFMRQTFQYKASEDATSFEMIFGVVGAA